MTEIVTWNVQRSRPPEEVKDDIVLLQESFQRSIICLQEMPIGDQVSLFGSNRLERDKENVIIYPAWYELKNTSVIPAQTKTRSFLHCILQQ